MSRGLEYARFTTVDEDGSPWLECMCDCGVTTNIKLAGMTAEALHGPVEFAYTCDDCMSAHWVIVHQEVI